MWIIRQVGQNDYRVLRRALRKLSAPGPVRHLRRPSRRQVCRCGTLGGATILALVCSGAGLPLLPQPSDGGGGSGGLPFVLDAAPPGTGGRLLVLGAPQGVQARGVADALSAYAGRLDRAEARRLAAVKKWGLGKAPPRPPAPPERKPRLVTEPGHVTGDGLPPVLVRVPTEEKVVFLTIDDGAEKDPELLTMLRQLGVPYSNFLSHEVARDDYGYFRAAHRDGAGVHNHSVSHPELPALSYAGQRAEICRQQDILEKEIGERPSLFRPPYGAYDRDTLRAAASCGIRAVPLWAEEAFPDRIEWGRADRKFHPGDIILTHFRGPGQWEGDMTDMVRRVLRTATEQGFALARLEDYL